MSSLMGAAVPATPPDIEALVQQRTAELVAKNEQLTRIAYTDNLTGLPNRTFLDERLARAFADSDLRGRVSFVMVDLNNLKGINDLLGHAAGDEALRVLAGIMRDACSTIDGATVARLGGDEFAVLAEGTPALLVFETACAIAELAFERLPSGAAVGLACAERLGERVVTSDDLLKLADAAQYLAKRTHSTVPVVANPDFAHPAAQSASQRRAFRGAPDDTERLFADVARALDGLPHRDVASPLRCAASVLAGPANVSAWTISSIAPGDDRFKTVHSDVSQIPATHSHSFHAHFDDPDGYLTADYPHSQHAAAGGLVIVRADDDAADRTERALVESGGFSSMVMAGGRDSAGRLWLLEAYSNDRGFQAEMYALPFRAGVALAITGSE